MGSTLAPYHNRYLVPYSQHFIFFVTYEWAKKAKVLAPGKPL